MVLLFLSVRLLLTDCFPVFLKRPDSSGSAGWGQLLVVRRQVRVSPVIYHKILKKPKTNNQTKPNKQTPKQHQQKPQKNTQPKTP